MASNKVLGRKNRKAQSPKVGDWALINKSFRFPLNQGQQIRHPINSSRDNRSLCNLAATVCGHEI